MRFIFDTGASDVSISMSQAKRMQEQKKLEISDIQGIEQYRIANGELVEGYRINLKKVEFGGLTLYNVQASISKNLDAPLLLGQSVIERLGKIQLEGNKLTILNGKNNSYNYAQEPTVSTSPSMSESASNGDIRAVYSYSPIIEKP